MLGGWTPGPCPLSCKVPTWPSRKWEPPEPSFLGHAAMASGPCSLSSLSSPAGEAPTLRCPHFEQTPHRLEPQIRSSPWPAVDGTGPLDQSSLPCALLDLKGLPSSPCPALPVAQTTRWPLSHHWGWEPPTPCLEGTWA